MKRIYSLDLLRVFAVIMIVLHHYQQLTGSWFGGKYSFLRFGIAVEFFFILSGFLTYKYVSDKKMDFPSFIKGKAKRLLPLVIITSVSYEMLLYVFNRVCRTQWPLGNDLTVWGTILNALGIQEGWVFENPGVNNPSWYVSVLLLCYVIFYFLVYISRKKEIPVTYLFLAMVFIGVGAANYGIDLPFLNLYAARGYYAFFFGLLLAKWLDGKELSWRWSVPALLVAAGILLGLKYQYNVFEEGFVYIITFVLYPAVLILFLSKPVRKMLDFKFIGVLGEITYDTYLWHVPTTLAMYIVFRLFSISVNLDYFRCVIIFTLGAFIIGAVSHFIIDRPVQKWLKKIEKKD